MPTEPVTLVVHGHFYQPPRENPWTEEVARELSAGPYHDWNERIAAECYRPNAFARIVDDRDRIVSICNNFERLSFDVGPTLMSWLEAHQVETYQRIVTAGRRGGAIAQAFGHMILPLATERDIQTQVRWGLADFRDRFGRRARGMWLPETAVNDAVLAILAEEGVGFTILAPTQATRVRPLDSSDGPGEDWRDVTDGGIDTSRPYRWCHPDGSGRGMDIAFYCGSLSHAAAFELSGLSSQALIDRVVNAAGTEGGLVLVATDGETFGHHHHWGDRLLAYALAVEAPRRRVDVTDVAGYLAHHRPEWQVEVRESAWSCGHGVARWQRDCGCATGGGPGWQQRWRTPLRAALDRLRDRATEVFERRGAGLFAGSDPWAARDAYVGVMLGVEPGDTFAVRHLAGGDPVTGLTLLEAQRHAMAMYTSCGWFFNDLAGLETVQVLRYAARVMDLLSELGEDPGEGEFLDELARAESNVDEEGDGRRLWLTHVRPTGVDAGRVVAHLALLALLDGGEPPDRLAAYTVATADHRVTSRGAVTLASGRATLRHTRTGRRTDHVYAAVHLGGLEVIGSVRPADDADPARDDADLLRLRDAFGSGAPLTTLLRLLTDGFGPREFGLADALPDVADRLVANAAAGVAQRFADACQRLFDDHRATLESLAALGEPLPPVLRQPAELALARRFEAEVAAQAGSLDPASYQGAMALVGQARAAGLRIATASTLAAGERLLAEAVAQAVVAGRTPAAGVAPAPVAADGRTAVDLALGLLDLAAALDLTPSLDRPQELVYGALRAAPTPELRRLGAALGLAVDGLDPPVR